MTAKTSILTRIQAWYRSQCDGDWEHTYGIKIETLDNPGWMVTIDLQDTSWETLRVSSSISERSETDWIQTEVTGGKFMGCGGVGNLEELLEVFLETVKAVPER